MSITGFSDAAQFQIVNNVVYYHNNGSSYLDKLKNGLPLDYVVELESADLSCCSAAVSTMVETTNDDGEMTLPTNPNWVEDQEYIHTIEFEHKLSKSDMKAKSGMKRKVKKPKSVIRTGGKDYKVFTSEQELGETVVQPAIVNTEIKSWLSEFLDNLVNMWNLRDAAANSNITDNIDFYAEEDEAEWRMRNDRYEYDMEDDDRYDDRYDMISTERLRDMDDNFDEDMY